MPGPIMITGMAGLNGRRNWDFLTKTGTRGNSSPAGFLYLSQLVATPSWVRFVGVVHSTRTAVILTMFGSIYGCRIRS